MKKIITTIITMLLLVLSLVLIIRLLNPSLFENNKSVTTTTTVMYDEEGYTLINFGNNFNSYQIDYDVEHDFNFYIQNIDILYSNDDIYIQGKLVVEQVSLYKYFALYDKNIIVILYTNLDDNKLEIITYDISKKRVKIIDKYDEMFAVLEDDIYFSDTGFVFNVSLISNNKINQNGKMVNICNIKDSKLIVKKVVEIKYDSAQHSFTDIEELSSITLNNYKKANKLCK